ncbi:hypothetical protein ABS71_17925 [bacterium SCN 62-11]|nr:hypothetical protein [Candidatus Eremiobacteraeota bacterium]ODT59380.1 MAG: hypothetical protein ABS71_17925 [bacterium SCN 62-11]
MNQADSQSIDDYLATFYESARLDSQGRFSLDLDARARKSAYQVTEPEMFLIPLMMAASLGGAQSFTLEPTPDGFALRFDAKTDPPTGARLHHLETALRLARELSFDDLELQPQALLCRLRENPLKRLFGSRILKVRTTLQKLLARRSAFPIQWPEAQLQIGSTDLSPRLGTLPSPDSGLLSLLPWGSPSQVLIFHHGVRFELPVPSQSRRPFRLWLRSDRVTPDLSYQSLVQTPELQQILTSLPIWLGELEWQQALLSQQFTPEILWDARQRSLHGLDQTPIEWKEKPPAVFQNASRAYGQLRYLPFTWHQGAPSQLDSGAPLLVRPFEEILDQVYPRQREFLVSQGRAIPSTSLLGQLLPDSQFWHVSPLQDGFQLGLNLQSQQHPAQIWRFTAKGFQATQPPAEAMPPGLTLATLESATPTDWQQRLVESLRQAWLDPQTELDPKRHAALLEHWLLAAQMPALRARLDPETIWLRDQQGRQVFLTDLKPGQDQNLDPVLRPLLRKLWGY